MLGIALFLYGLYALFRGGFHLLLGGPIGNLTGADIGGFGTGCWYFVKSAIAVALAGMCGLAGV